MKTMPWLTPQDPFARAPKLKPVRQRPGQGLRGDVVNPDDLETFEQGDDWIDIDSVEIDEGMLDLTAFETVQIVDSYLKGVRVIVGPQTMVTIRDSVIERCDLSRLRSEAVLRSKLVGCKLSGAEFAGFVRDSRFVDCSIQMANLTMSRLERVLLEDCDLKEVDCFQATLSDVNFPGSSIVDLGLDQGEFERVDFRQAASLGLKSGKSFHGCLLTIGQVQELAPWFAHQLGVGIEVYN